MSPTQLTAAERRYLLRVARHAILDAVCGDDSPKPIHDATEISPGLRTPRGVFVTLKMEERLRGCIGIMESGQPLVDTLIRLAPRAALEDSRFPPLEAGELPLVRVSISVLTPLEEIDGPDRIVIGRHGVQLAEDTHRAVFLPEVAAEQGWDVAQLLHHLAAKAGLAPGLRPGARLWIFQTEVFSEEPRAPTG